MFRRRRPNRLTYTRPRSTSATRIPRSTALPPESRDTRRGSLVAAGERVTRSDSEGLRRLVQSWQNRAYGYYDTVPEIKYGAQFYSRMLAPLRLFAARIDEHGEVEEIDEPKGKDDELAVANVERIQDPGGGRSGLLGTYGRLMFLGGEGYLTVTEDDGIEQWEILSPQELRLSPGGDYYRLRAPQLAPEMIRNAPDDSFEALNEGEAVVYRLWRRHPVFSSLADSTMQAVLEVCEELLLLSRGVRNRTRSRIASAGLLLVNGEVTSVSMSGDEAEENPDEDLFLRDLTEAAVAAISDESSASSVVPLIVRVDAGDDKGGLDNVMKHIQFVDPNQLVPEMGQRREAIERLAVGLDMPPEVLLGISGVNHWSGWMIDEHSWKLHGHPVAQSLVEDLTAAYYRPTLKADGVVDWQSYCIGFDPAAVINHPDKSKDAKDLHDRGSLSDQALREAAGFDDDDAPSKEERQVWLGVQLRDSSVAIDGIPSVKAGGVEPTPGELVKAGEKTVDAGTSSSEADKTPPTPPAEQDQPGSVSAALVSRIVGACDASLYRTLELAGARLRTYANRDDEILKTLDGVPNLRVAATLGPEFAKKIGAPSVRALVAGVRPMLEETLRLWGIDQTIAAPLADRIEQHAARMLFQERTAPLPQSFENFVRGLEAVAVR